MATAAVAKSNGGKEKSDFDQLKEDIASIRDDFSALAATTKKLAAGQVKRQARRVGDMADSAMETAGDYRDMLTDKVKEHPLAAIGIAVLAGAIISSMRRH